MEWLLLQTNIILVKESSHQNKMVQIKKMNSRETKSKSILSAALGVIPDDDYPTIVKNGDSSTLKNRRK